MKKLLLILCYVSNAAIGQVGMVSADSATLSGTVRFANGIVEIETKNPVARFMWFANLYNLPDPDLYEKKQVGEITADHTNGMVTSSFNLPVKLKSYSDSTSSDLSIFPNGDMTYRPVASNASAKFTSVGFTRLGENAPAIKMRKITGTTASSQGGNVTIPLGIASYKILGVQVLVEYGANSFLSANYGAADGYEFNYFIYGGISGAIYILNKPGNSTNILSKPFKVLVTYED
ncbi:hypothetical protein [Emticicia sp. BO119]|uniref:hypothetical protein n=1 Tax=Emticicia sp. BO119 TaxID=2757768 RepID=UPI0015EFF3AB|nr:hypothetical protein [Emticicia sp. BO119]MBA4848952.1 hypothetical protein [Emticicia sp. BO119]